MLEGIWRDGFGYTCVIVAGLNIGGHLSSTFYTFMVGSWAANQQRKAINKLKTALEKQDLAIKSISNKTSKEYKALQNVVDYKERLKFLKKYKYTKEWMRRNNVSFKNVKDDVLY